MMLLAFAQLSVGKMEPIAYVPVAPRVKSGVAVHRIWPEPVAVAAQGFMTAAGQVPWAGTVRTAERKGYGGSL